MTVLPADASAEGVRQMRPDGLLLSGGPGDPGDVPQGAALVRRMLGEIPILGVGLGHQLIALASGAATYKMKTGHHGGNQPVRDVETGAIRITSQNHGYAVDADSVKGTPLRVTHINVLDGTVEGLESAALRVLSVQYEPGAPSFDRLLRHIDETRGEVRHAQA